MIDLEPNYYFDKEFQRQIDEAIERKDHADRRPRATKFQADRFYNFRKKKARKSK